MMRFVVRTSAISNRIASAATFTTTTTTTTTTNSFANSTNSRLSATTKFLPIVAHARTVTTATASSPSSSSSSSSCSLSFSKRLFAEQQQVTHSIYPFRRRSFTTTSGSTMGNSGSSPEEEDSSSSSSSASLFSSSLPNIRSYNKQYINGKWIDSTIDNSNDDGDDNDVQIHEVNESTLDVIDSNTGQIVATVPNGTENDTKKAIAAAKAALPSWKQTSIETRLIYINVFLKKFELHREEIVNRTIVELGCTKSFANDVQTNAMVGHTITLLNLLETNKEDGSKKKAKEDTFEWEYSAGKCTVVKEPIGVVGCITPWNYPLNQIALKVIPALLAGCTVVLKPSEITPLIAYSLAEAIHEAQLPPGVFNMIVGEGPECGEILARSPDIDLVSFTGSTRAGQILTQVAAESGTMKPIKTELGGKSATLLLEDADYENVVPKFIKQLTSNTGQSCNALSRMIVPRDDYQKVLELAASTMKEEIVGDSRINPDVTMGPLISKVQYDRVIDLINKGVEEGATLVCGGIEKPNGLDESLKDGYFVQPTLFSNVTNDMTIAQTEIFGPVLSVIPYDTLEEAIQITNDTPYGLNNAVASQDLKKAIQVASQLQSGMVMINKTDCDLKAPFGGYKQSGNAREWGVSGLDEFLITKTINMTVEEYREVMYGTGTGAVSK